MIQPIGVLFVCMGNICRSPTAEGVFRHYVEHAGLTRRIVVDSAGTLDYHAGEPPDFRAQRAAERRRYDLSGLRARQVRPRDFEEFDYILAMDRDNLAHLQRLSPPWCRKKVQLFLEYAAGGTAGEVPDPYYGNQAAFELVLDLAEDASRGLLEHIQKRLGSAQAH
jgi:low molecular weight protein-tyrosine phosphatase